jgi:hypothetical protein
LSRSTCLGGKQQPRSPGALPPSTANTSPLNRAESDASATGPPYMRPLHPQGKRACLYCTALDQRKAVRAGRGVPVAETLHVAQQEARDVAL